MNTKEKLLSVDKPYLELLPKFDYDPNFCKKTVYQMANERAKGYDKIPAINFYGNKMRTDELLNNIDNVANSYTEMGLKKNDNISFFGLNTPELVESLYAVDKIGAVSEWFNPNAITPELLKNHIKNNNVKAIFTIDIMYDIVKKAIQDTDVEFVVVNSVMDSLPKGKNILYYLKTFGLDSFINIDALKRYKEGMYSKLENAKSYKEKEQIISEFSFVKKLVYNIYDYCYKEKIFAKTSYYNDKEIDPRFISWKDFIEKNKNRTKFKANDDYEKMSMVVHTGGTTGPIKRIAMNDYAANSAPYQASLMPNTFEVGDSILQIVPPMVAWSLETIQVSRFYNMTLNMIATYDREEFAKIILSTKSNHYLTVPSFVKRIAEDKKLKNKDLSFIKTIFHGGEGMPKNDEQEVDAVLRKNGSPTRSALGFGQNEEFGGFFVNLYIPGIEKEYETCGIPLPGNEYMIYDIDNNCELEYGKNKDGKYNIGNLLVSGPSTMMCYLGEDAYLNEKAILNINGKRYIDTGDLAYADENGRLHYYTREKRIVRTQQGKIFVNVIENLLNKMEEVEESCVVKMPDYENVAKASCHIVLKERYRALSYEQQKMIMNKIIERVEEKTKEMYTYYVPGYYEFNTEKLPITPVGKIDYRSLENADQEEFTKTEGKVKKLRINKK